MTVKPATFLVSPPYSVGLNPPWARGYTHQQNQRPAVETSRGIIQPQSKLQEKLSGDRVQFRAIEGTLKTPSPQELWQNLYRQVWMLIQRRYVDPTFNGQDWNLWQHRYDGKLNTEEECYGAIRAMLTSLGDPHTRFIDAKEFILEDRISGGSKFGIGLEIRARDGKIQVLDVVENAPAARAGIKAKDVILAVDGQNLEGRTSVEAGKLIRGEEGSLVTLLVQRRKSAPKSYSLKREKIKIKSVSVEPPIQLKPQVGYLRLLVFSENYIRQEVQNALAAMKGKQGYILDLRANPGGSFSAAIDIANYFLSEGTIVSTVNREGFKESFLAVPCNQRTNKPLVVLVNQASASASELFSGALHDNNRAVLVGKKTFGKAAIQHMGETLGRTGLMLTIKKYLTPNGTDINGVGIMPDIEVDMPTLKENEAYDPKKHGDPQLAKAQLVLLDLISGKSFKYLQTRSLIEKANASP